ncbi:MAG: hypothetical protein A3B15_01805 [Candidatus Buchananbacteria bacterium RIFCSPLOWO2_01_FULL_45_31]|uniref:Fibronectin type-III domain-containing protein n=1 Tax=Candidatus Buchananbacteria bacterium RIFCSPLOWO2_01_FULL_45_31 TaxID=1797545 RepID=A0A1G1YKT9_9BACT|nr:MAG: hypothetical protein A3B15_01805 [Candidatus Buchananbacteria bacterium RIFCSPLOWO2_01_FULL_45_31]
MISINQAWPYLVADTVRYPLDNYVVGSNYFGRYNLLGNNKWHLGDDASAIAGTNVYAIGNGIVRHAAYHPPSYDANGLLVSRNYGGMYIIEHDVNGEKTCALYVHMNFATFAKNEGQEVTKGEYLGQIGNYDQNGGWPEHFHFGIRKGEYPENPNEYIYGDWIFSGYTANQSVLDYWHNPSDFIAGHSQNIVIARFSDGAIHQPILDCYNSFSSLNLGQPYDNGGGVYVHQWYSQNGSAWVEIQDFRNSATGEYFAIVNNPRLSQAFLLKGGFRWYYMTAADGPGFFGPPTVSERLIDYYPIVDGAFDYTAQSNILYIGQDFETGKMLLWRELNCIYVVDTGGSGGDDLIEIALVPGDGQNLILRGWALSSAEIYLTANAINGAANYLVYRNESPIGNLAGGNLELTVSGLTPDTSYEFKVKALDANGLLLKESGSLTVTTQTAAIGRIDVILHADLFSIIADWTEIQGADHYDVFFNDNFFGSSGDCHCVINNLDLGVNYQIRIQARTFTDELLAEGTASIMTGQNIKVYPEAINAPVGPNQQGRVNFFIRNNTAYPLTNFTNCLVNWDEPQWFMVASHSFPPPGEIPPWTTTLLYSVDYATADFCPPAIERIALVVVATFNCQYDNFTSAMRGGTCLLAVAPFVDLAPSLAADLGRFNSGDEIVCPITISNIGNSQSAPARLEIWVGEALAVSVLIPEIPGLNRQPWNQTMPLGIFPEGNYQVRAVIDSLNEVNESLEDNNIAFSAFTANPAPRPDLVIAGFAPASPEFTGSEPVCLAGAVLNQGLGSSGPSQLGLFFPPETLIKTAEIPGLNAGEYHDFSVFIDTALPDGTSLISALADSNGVVAESDEGNNGAECSVVIAELALPLVHIPFGCRGKTSKPDGDK